MLRVDTRFILANVVNLKTIANRTLVEHERYAMRHLTLTAHGKEVPVAALIRRAGPPPARRERNAFYLLVKAFDGGNHLTFWN